VLETAELISKAKDDLGQRNSIVEATNCAVACTSVAGRDVGGRIGNRALALVRAGYNISEPRVETLGSGINGSVRTVDSDTSLGQLEKGSLLRVIVGDGLETTKDKRV
jgi:hypothetical protein